MSKNSISVVPDVANLKGDIKIFCLPLLSLIIQGPCMTNRSEKDNSWQMPTSLTYLYCGLFFAIVPQFIDTRDSELSHEMSLHPRHGFRIVILNYTARWHCRPPVVRIYPASHVFLILWFYPCLVIHAYQLIESNTTIFVKKKANIQRTWSHKLAFSGNHWILGCICCINAMIKHKIILLCIPEFWFRDEKDDFPQKHRKLQH
jgi:hypothetical protein